MFYQNAQEDLTSIDVGVSFSRLFSSGKPLFLHYRVRGYIISRLLSTTKKGQKKKKKKKKVLFHSFTCTLHMEDLCNLFSFRFGVLRFVRFVERINLTLSGKSVS